MPASIELQPGARVKCVKLTAVKQYCGAARGTGGGNEQWVNYAREIPRGPASVANRVTRAQITITSV